MTVQVAGRAADRHLVGKRRALLALGGIVLLGSAASAFEGGTSAPSRRGDERSLVDRSRTPPTTTVQLEAATATTPSTAPAPSTDGSVGVASITDGDTFRATGIGPVRLAQVDAPETNECYGAESTQALRVLIEGKTVVLRQPSNGPARDRYGRTLAEVTVDGKSVNEALIAGGDAEWYESFAHEDAALAARLEQAERSARAQARGLWSACSRTSSQGAAPVAANAPATTLPPVATAAPATSAAPAQAAASGGCHPGYPDGCIPPGPPDLNCPDIARRVRVDHAFGDPHRFDANKDGWGCESYG